MTTSAPMAGKPYHEGRNVKRIREILGIKQESLAMELGLSQQAISQLEQKEELDTELLVKIATFLKVPLNAIKNFDEQAAVNVISNTFHDNSANNVNYQCTFNPLDKMVELYERMLKDKNEMIEKLESLLKERK